MNLENEDSVNKEKWELELSIVVDDNVWEDLCPNSQLWKEFDWKLNLRYFLISYSM